MTPLGAVRLVDRVFEATEFAIVGFLQRGTATNDSPGQASTKDLPGQCRDDLSKAGKRLEGNGSLQPATWLRGGEGVG